MKLHTFPGAPNPLRVDLLIAEKGIDIETLKVDLMTKEQLTPDFMAKNPACDVPVLELDDGTWISQVPAILLYLERKFPNPPLYGTSPEAAAVVMMWEHLMAQNGMGAVNEVLRNTSKGMIGRALTGPHGYEQIPALAERGRLRIRHFFTDLNARLSSNAYVAGDFFSAADITAWASVNFGRWVKELPGEEHQALLAWYQKLEQRPAFQQVLAANKK